MQPIPGLLGVEPRYTELPPLTLTVELQTLGIVHDIPNRLPKIKDHV